MMEKAEELAREILDIKESGFYTDSDYESLLHTSKQLARMVLDGLNHDQARQEQKEKDVKIAEEHLTHHSQGSDCARVIVKAIRES